MRVEYLNPFIKATNDVFQMMLGLKTEKKDLKVQQELTCSNDVNVMLGITGDVQGSIIFGFPKNMVLEMVKIMSGLEIDEINSFVSSALGEVANIISGNAMTFLSHEGFFCDIVPPRVFVGDYKTFKVKDECSLLLTLNTEIGEFELDLFLKEKLKN